MTGFGIITIRHNFEYAIIKPVMLIKKTTHKKLTIGAISVLMVLMVGGIGVYGVYSYSSVQQIVQINNKVKAASEMAVKAAAVREAKKKEPVYITLPGAKSVRALVEDYSTPDSIWTLLSKTHPVSIDYVPANLKIPNVMTRTDKSDLERSIRSDVEQPMINMFTAASASGYQLMIGSGYRSAALQATYFNSLASSVGETAANQSIAKPGQSEHQTGLAADITTVSRNCYLDNCFADTSDGQWLANNSYKYGFILRYPKDKEAITGYQYESWHFRYVGIDLATALHDSGLTLDEAWPYLEKADVTLKQNGAI